MLHLSSKIDSEIENTLYSKIELFKEKTKYYFEELKRVIENIENKTQEREGIEEGLTLKTDSAEVTTYKKREPEKQNKVVAGLKLKKSHLEEKNSKYSKVLYPVFRTDSWIFRTRFFVSRNRKK